MKEKPILFSGPMIKAILEGRKRMTRRVAKVDDFGNLHLRHGWSIQADAGIQDVRQERLPWHTGMRLWVRETWAHVTDYDGQFLLDNRKALYRADGETNITPTKWRPSIFMPRWASRITLELTGVRVERVQDISTADVEAEGFDVASKLPPVVPAGTNLEILAWQVAQDLFRKTWDALNGKRGFPWESNPWVWVLEFKRVD
jgi:hypothetical protein